VKRRHWGQAKQQFTRNIDDSGLTIDDSRLPPIAKPVFLL
jgi:hypothetical protein